VIWVGSFKPLQSALAKLTEGTELRAPVTQLTQGALKCPSHTLADADRAHIIATLRETNWVVGGPNGAAKKLAVKRTTFIKKMQKLGILKETAKASSSPSSSFRERRPV